MFGRHTQTPTLPVQAEPTPAQRPPEMALTRASAPTARVPELINETAAEVLTAGWTLIKKSPGWTLLCSYNK